MFKFIGRGAAFNTEQGNNGAFIKHDDLLFMIDCGSSTFGRIQKSGLLKGINHIHVLMTHTHPDHVGSLGDLILFGYYSMGELAQPNVTVHAPFDLGIRHILRSMGVEENTYTLSQFDHSGGLHYGDFHLNFEPVEVKHVDELTCFGYVFSYENKKVYYSGDSNMIPEDILERHNKGEFHLFYQDTCKADYDGNVHLSLRKLDELIKYQVRDRVYCMHLDNNFSEYEAIELGFNVVTTVI